MLLRGMLVMTVRFKCVPVCHLVVMRCFVMIACLVSLMGFMVVVEGSRSIQEVRTGRGRGDGDVGIGGC